MLQTEPNILCGTPSSISDACKLDQTFSSWCYSMAWATCNSAKNTFLPLLCNYWREFTKYWPASSTMYCAVLKLAAQPSTLLFSASIASSSQNPLCIILVDSGMSCFMPMLSFIARVYSTAIFSRVG